MVTFTPRFRSMAQKGYSKALKSSFRPICCGPEAATSSAMLCHAGVQAGACLKRYWLSRGNDVKTGSKMGRASVTLRQINAYTTTLAGTVLRNQHGAHRVKISATTGMSM